MVLVLWLRQNIHAEYTVPLHPCLFIILFLWKEIWDTLRWEFKQDFKNIRKENTLSPKKKVRFKKKKRKKARCPPRKKERKEELDQENRKENKILTMKKRMKTRTRKKRKFLFKTIPTSACMQWSNKTFADFFYWSFSVCYVAVMYVFWCGYTFCVRGYVFVYVDMCLCT